MSKFYLYNDDCMSILPTIPNVSIDLVICDPPYGITKHKWDVDLNWDTVFKELNRVTKPGAAIVLFGQEPFSSSIIQHNLKHYKHKWIWNKKASANFVLAKYMPLSITEDILVFSKGKLNYFPQMRKGKIHYRGSKNASISGQGFGGVKQIYYKSDEYYPVNLLDFKTVTRKQSLHPSQKPVELLEYLIKTYSLENQIVLDFTMGVGSTGVACRNTNRNFIGVEKDTNYFQIAEKRIYDR